MSDEQAEPNVEQAIETAGLWYGSFIKSPYFEGLSGPHKDSAWRIISCFADYACNYCGAMPEAWEPGDATECCLEILPRKITAEIDFYEAISPVLTAFFRYLGEHNLQRHAKPLAELMAGLGPEIVAQAQDPRNWGPAKGFMMSAMKAGVDLCDERAILQHMFLHNLRVAARLTAEQSSPPKALASPKPPAPSGKWLSSTPTQKDKPRVGRNDPCPCGSGRKYKKCCGMYPK